MNKDTQFCIIAVSLAIMMLGAGHLHFLSIALATFANIVAIRSNGKEQ